MCGVVHCDSPFPSIQVIFQGKGEVGCPDGSKVFVEIEVVCVSVNIDHDSHWNAILISIDSNGESIFDGDCNGTTGQHKKYFPIRNGNTLHHVGTLPNSDDIVFKKIGERVHMVNYTPVD